ncbi:MAG: hypothetical protein HY720_10860 [Planctomycetes bacterium]|nr:hypothetical protein [Planctomycetota bacterium]
MRESVFRGTARHVPEYLFGIGVALVFASGLFAQQDGAIEKVLAFSLPEERPVAYQMRLVSSLDRESPFAVDMHGRFESPERSTTDATSSTWAGGRVASFLASGEKIALREEPPPGGATPGWVLFERKKEREREPLYGRILLPGEFVAEIGTHVRSLTEAGSRGMGEIECDGYEGPLATDKARSLAARLGFVIGEKETVESVRAGLTLWVGREDSLLRSVNLEIEIEVKRPMDAKGPAGAAGGGASGQGELAPGFRGTGATDSGTGGSGTGEISQSQIEFRNLSILLILDQIVDGPPPRRIEPDPEAAALVGW